MAYITKAEVAAKSEALRVLNKEYGVTARFSGSNSSSLTLTIQSGGIDFIGNRIEVLNSGIRYVEPHVLQHVNNAKTVGNLGVNHYYLNEQHSGIALEYLQKVYDIMLDGHRDDSDIMTDYFCCSWYNSIEIGKWNKPYILKG